MKGINKIKLSQIKFFNYHISFNSQMHIFNIFEVETLLSTLLSSQHLTIAVDEFGCYFWYHDWITTAPPHLPQLQPFQKHLRRNASSTHWLSSFHCHLLVRQIQYYHQNMQNGYKIQLGRNSQR